MRPAVLIYCFPLTIAWIVVAINDETACWHWTMPHFGKRRRLPSDIGGRLYIYACAHASTNVDKHWSAVPTNVHTPTTHSVGEEDAVVGRRFVRSGRMMILVSRFHSRFFFVSRCWVTRTATWKPSSKATNRRKHTNSRKGESRATVPAHCVHQRLVAISRAVACKTLLSLASYSLFLFLSTFLVRWRFLDEYLPQSSHLVDRLLNIRFHCKRRFYTASDDNSSTFFSL